MLHLVFILVIPQPRCIIGSMLTSKREIFCQGLAGGLTQSEAYRRSHDASGMKTATLNEEASRLAAVPDVSLRVAELREASTAKFVEKRVWDLERLVDEAETNMAGAREDRQWSAANGSLTTIGKATGLLVDKMDVSVTHTLKPGLSLEELEARLQRLDALDVGVVDGTSEVIE